MSEEKKQTAGEEDQIGESANDNDRNLDIDARSETSDYYSNDAHYSANDLRPDSETELASSTAEELQVEPNDVLKIEELSGELR